MNTIKVKLILKSEDRHIIEIMSEQHQNLPDAVVANLNQIYEDLRLVCEQMDREFQHFQGQWLPLYCCWSQLKEMSLNIGEEGVKHIVVYSKDRTVNVRQNGENETWVYCVTLPQIDYGRVICIKGPVAEQRLVYISTAIYAGNKGHPGVSHFKKPILGMNGNQAWVTANSNTIYFMDPDIYAFNLERVNNAVMRQTAANLGQGLLALKNHLQEAIKTAEKDVNQVLQDYYAQIEVVTPNVEPPPDEIPLDRLIDLDTLSAENQKDFQDLVNELDIDQIGGHHDDETLPQAIEAPVEPTPDDDDALLDRILEGKEGQNQEDIQELVNSLDVGKDQEVEAPLQVKECVNNCNQRFEQSYQQIEQLLQEVYQLCLKRNKMEAEMHHAVNIILGKKCKLGIKNPKQTHLFRRRHGTMSVPRQHEQQEQHEQHEQHDSEGDDSEDSE